MSRISENQLLLPSLFLISLSQTKSLSTSQLIPKLRDLLKPSGEDLEILSNRNDDKFSQKVRNLKAHNTFDRHGYAEYKNRTFYITPEGEKYLKNNMDKLIYLLVNDFSWEYLKEGLDIVENSTKQKRKIQIFDETILIREGFGKLVETRVYERSVRLRKIAIEHFTKNDDIICDACKFSYGKFYGEIGKGYIEIHHIKPIFKYEDEELDETIYDALNNVVPICSNCHRIIHRDWRNPLKLDYLIEQINQNGIINKV
jgi:predicted HNH restriction endonuclease